MQWTRVENRDPIKTYNKTAIAELPALMPDYDWQRYLARRRHRGQGRLRDRQPAELFHRPRQADDTARRCRSGRLTSSGRCCRPLRPICRRPSSMSASPSPARVLRGIPENRAALEARHRAARRQHGRGAGQALCREIFPAAEQGAHAGTGAESARGLSPRHRDAGLDEPGDQERRAGQAGQDA